MKLRQTGQERRNTLLQSALELFASQGYDGTTTRAIAERAGVTEAMLFKHFATKQELLRAVVAELSPKRIFSPPDPIVHTLSARDAVERLLTTYLDTFWDKRAYMRMVFTTPPRDQHLYAELWEEFSKQTLYLFTILNELEDRDEIRKGIATPLTDVISAASSGFLQRVLSTEPSEWNASRKQFVENLLKVLFG